MADLIDRQAAIDAVKDAVIKDEQQYAEDAIKALPPVYVPDINDGDMISRQAAIDALNVLCQEHRYKIPGKRETYSQYNEAWQDALDRAEGAIFNLPPVQPTNELLERCKFEYIHACKIVSIPTPDVTGKDIQDAYAVIKALQPIFGNVPFAKAKRGDSDAAD